MQTRIALGITFALLFAFCSPAQALSFRAYLSVNGSDSNPCTVQLPCRLLPAALSAINDGGEVWILDSANFNSGPVAVTRSASILAIPGAVGSLVVLGGPAISISAPNLTVSLRNLVIVPFASSGSGISMTAASTLTLEGTLIANLAGTGVVVSGGGKLKIVNSIIRNNSGYAVSLSNGPAAEIAGTQMLANGFGGVALTGDAAATTTASVSDSIISGVASGDACVFASASQAGAALRVFVSRSTLSSCNYGIDSQTNGTGAASVALSASMVVNNNFAWFQDGAGSAIRTLGNNHITDNASTFGALTSTAQQ
jgi:hypothetical protein